MLIYYQLTHFLTFCLLSVLVAAASMVTSVPLDDKGGVIDKSLLKSLELSSNEFDIVVYPPMLWEETPFEGKDKTGIRYAGLFFSGGELGNPTTKEPEGYFILAVDRPDLSDDIKLSMGESLSKIVREHFSDDEYKQLTKAWRHSTPDAPFDQAFVTMKHDFPEGTVIMLIRAIRGEREILLLGRVYLESKGAHPNDARAWILLDGIHVSKK